MTKHKNSFATGTMSITMFLFDHSRGKKKSNDTICFISTTTDMLVNYAIIRYEMAAHFYLNRPSVQFRVHCVLPEINDQKTTFSPFGPIFNYTAVHSLKPFVVNLNPYW